MYRFVCICICLSLRPSLSLSVCLYVCSPLFTFRLSLCLSPHHSLFRLSMCSYFISFSHLSFFYLSVSLSLFVPFYRLSVYNTLLYLCLSLLVSISFFCLSGWIFSFSHISFFCLSLSLFVFSSRLPLYLSAPLYLSITYLCPSLLLSVTSVFLSTCLSISPPSIYLPLSSLPAHNLPIPSPYILAGEGRCSSATVKTPNRNFFR